MKIHFTKLPTTGGKIQVSLDGGQTFTDYNEEQWNAITKSSNWNNGCRNDMVINYNYAKEI